MKASRFLLVLAGFALVVGFAWANDSQVPVQPVLTELAVSPVVEAPSCSATAPQPFDFGVQSIPFPPDLCAQCLAACHPQDFLCIQACLNGPCI